MRKKPNWAKVLRSIDQLVDAVGRCDEDAAKACCKGFQPVVLSPHGRITLLEPWVPTRVVPAHACWIRLCTEKYNEDPNEDNLRRLRRALGYDEDGNYFPADVKPRRENLSEPEE